MWWKIYFFIFAFLMLLGIISLLVQGSVTGLLTFPFYASAVISTIGVYSYAFGRKFWSAKFWKIFWWVHLLIFGIEILSSNYSNSFVHALFYLHGAAAKPSSLASVLGLAFDIPVLYILFRLAFRKWFKQKSKKKVENIIPYSDLAISSLILGLIGILLPIIFTIPSAILGILALQKIATSKERGVGMAWFGIGVFFFQVILLFLFVCYALILAYTSNAQSEPAQTEVGAQAVKKMNPVEIRFLHKYVDKIKSESTAKDMRILLGESQSIINLKEDGIQYLFPCPYSRNDEACTIRVNFFDNNPYRIIWSEQGRFKYIKDLTKDPLFSV